MVFFFFLRGGRGGSFHCVHCASTVHTSFGYELVLFLTSLCEKQKFYNVISDAFNVNNSVCCVLSFLFIIWCFSFHFPIVWLILLLIYLFITRHTVYGLAYMCAQCSHNNNWLGRCLFSFASLL